MVEIHCNGQHCYPTAASFEEQLYITWQWRQVWILHNQRAPLPRNRQNYGNHDQRQSTISQATKDFCPDQLYNDHGQWLAKSSQLLRIISLRASYKDMTGTRVLHVRSLADKNGLWNPIPIRNVRLVISRKHTIENASEAIQAEITSSAWPVLRQYSQSWMWTLNFSCRS